VHASRENEMFGSGEAVAPKMAVNKSAQVGNMSQTQHTEHGRSL